MTHEPMPMTFGTPYWWEAAKPRADFPTTPPAQTEILVIGGGYTGLSAAITAARAGAEVTVIDAGLPGTGASSRNGGMAGAHPRLSLSETTKKFGAETAKGLFNEATPAFEHLQTLLKREKIACDYQDTGRIQLAWTRADFENQKAMAEEMNRLTDYPVEVLGRDELPAHINTPHYFGALYYPSHGALHPAKFHAGLVKAADALGVTIIQNCPILHVEAGWAEWAGGKIAARKILMATNGYTKGSGALRFLDRRIFALPSYIIATEELPKSVLKKIAPGKRMMVETRARHSYYRLSPDGKRVIWGGRAAIRQMHPKKAASRLAETMAQIWPDLKGVTLTHSWKGNTGYTFQTAPQLGEIDGVHYAAGYCGGGVVLAPYLGMKAAFQMLGDENGKTAYSGTRLGTKPYYAGGFPWFLEFADRWYTHVVDPSQNRKAAQDQAKE